MGLDWITEWAATDNPPSMAAITRGQNLLLITTKTRAKQEMLFVFISPTSKPKAYAILQIQRVRVSPIV